jgi:hypothetical protein
MECYLELARRNEPVNKAEKVIDFLSWIAASELQRLCIILKKNGSYKFHNAECETH